MAHDVFISYSSKDRSTADAACAMLESLGARCWIAPRDVTPGSDWSEAIVDAIAASRVVVLIFSENANHSPQVRREVEQAVSKEVTLVPFRIENVPPCKSLQYFISVPHWMDAWSGPLESHLAELSDRVSAILEPGAPAARTPLLTDAAERVGRTGLPRVVRARRYKALGGLALAGVKIVAIVVAFIFFFGRFPWPHLRWAAAGGAPPLPPALSAAPSLPPARFYAAPVPAAPPAQTDQIAGEAQAAREAEAAQAAQAVAQSLRLTSVVVIGRERLCTIDSMPLREGDSIGDFVIQEIQSNYVVVSRDGAQFHLRLQPRPGE